MIGFLSKYAVAALAIALLATLAALGVQSARLSASKQATAEVKAAWATDRANAQALAVKTLNEYRAKEQEDQAKLKAKQDDYDTLQAQHAPVLAALAATRADNGRLRNDLASYASGVSAASDTVAACRSRAETLSGLLAGALQADGEHAADAELAADAVRTLLDAWPQRFEVPEKRISHEKSPIVPRVGP